MQTMRQGSCKGLYSGVVPALSNPLERKIRRGSCAFRRSSMEKSLSCRLILVWCSRMSVTLRVSWLAGRELGFPSRGSAGCPSALLACAERHQHRGLSSREQLHGLWKEKHRRPEEEVKGFWVWALTALAADHPTHSSDPLVFYIKFTSSQLQDLNWSQFLGERLEEGC